MNDFDVKETTASSSVVVGEDGPKGMYDMTDILSLPPISAQACPLTMTRENSVLTKRLSYSDNLKKERRRSSIQFSKADMMLMRGEKYVQESLENISKSKSNYDGSIDDNNLESNLILSELRNQQSHAQLRNSKSYSIEPQRKTSRGSCQLLLAKIQRKFNNKSLRKCTTNKTGVTEANKEVRCKRCKQHLTVSMLFKNDSSRKDNQHPYCYCKQNNKKNKRCPRAKDKKKRIDEGYEIEIEKELPKSTYEPTFRCGNNKEKRPKENSVLVGKSIEVTKCLDIPARGCKKVYYSERQSVTVYEIPGVPPCSPNEIISYGIASLSDIKSQRRIQQKLLGIRNKQRQKEEEILASAKAKEIQQKLAKKKELMETQRRQIYAINKILADIENENFLNFKTQNSGVPV